ncbi:MAG: GCN5-related N-acetyltransferase (GNAT)-like protein [Bacteroidota bacterium]|nr:GCN5-related N-acetyltransferase (GNAT)-like protein [Bacteroidota bacterium]
MSNFERMIQLAEDVFSTHNDPAQLDVDEKVMEQLQRLHPATLSQHDEGDGPVVWILLIPTTIELMNQFIAEKISESELLYKTPLNIKYEALYLCSALVLPEFRKKGLATKTGLAAIHQIRATHPIKYLFTWSFSKEGAIVATKAAEHEGLPLLERVRKIK